MHSRDKYYEDDLYRDAYYAREDMLDKEIYSRDGGYGHSGGYGGGYGVSHKKFDIYSLLAFGAFALAIGFLLYYCLPDPTRCDGMERRRRRSLPPNKTLEEVAPQMEFILGLIERAENLWEGGKGS